MATKKGKGIFATSKTELILGLIIAVLVIVPIIGYTVYINKVEPKVETKGDNVQISAFLSNTIEFSAQEIESVDLVNFLPAGTRVNGLGTRGHLRGNYKYEGYGKTKVFIYRKYPPYVLIKLKDKPSVFINSQSQETTHKIYASLLALYAETEA